MTNREYFDKIMAEWDLVGFPNPGKNTSPVPPMNDAKIIVEELEYGGLTFTQAREKKSLLKRQIMSRGTSDGERTYHLRCRVIDAMGYVFDEWASTIPGMITLRDYWLLLQNHDWWAAMSDSNGVAMAGEQERKFLVKIAEINPELIPVLEAWSSYKHHDSVPEPKLEDFSELL